MHADPTTDKDGLRAIRSDHRLKSGLPASQSSIMADVAMHLCKHMIGPEHVIISNTVPCAMLGQQRMFISFDLVYGSLCMEASRSR